MSSKNYPQISPRKSSAVPSRSTRAVPSRTSRKRAAEEDKENEPQCVESFTAKDAEEIAELEKSLDQGHKKLKAKGSLGVDFWSQNKAIVETKMRWNNLKRKQSVNDFVAQGGKEVVWNEEQQAEIFREEKRSLELRLRVIEKQINRLVAPVDNGVTTISRRWFMELLNSAPIYKGGMGAGNTSAQGRRPAERQSYFRKALIEVCRSAGGPGGDELWCPVLGEYLERNTMKAAHIFPYAAGQEAMDNLFGRKNGRSELFEPENGLMLHMSVEVNIELGFMAIVPNIPDEPTKEERAAWSFSKVKSYKLEIINENAKGHVKLMPFGFNDENGERLWWKSQHGRVLQFKSDFRPRARYLWWQSALSHLRKVWRYLEEKREPDLKMRNKFFWGTKGSCIRKGPLFAIAEEVGVPLESLLDAAMDGDEENDDRQEEIDDGEEKNHGEAGADDEEGLAARLLADWQLEQSRIRTDEDQDEFDAFREEEQSAERDDDQTGDAL